MHTSPEVAHACPPPPPQKTVWLQLFVVEPHFFVPHATAADSALQPHAPPVQLRPPSQPPQSTGCAQLSVLGPQRSVQKPVSEVQRHWCVVVSQTLFAPQSLLHVRGSLQLSFEVPQCVSQKPGSGVHVLVPGPVTPPSLSVAGEVPASSPLDPSMPFELAASWSESRPESAVHPYENAPASAPATKMRRQCISDLLAYFRS